MQYIYKQYRGDTDNADAAAAGCDEMRRLRPETRNEAPSLRCPWQLQAAASDPAR